MCKAVVTCSSGTCSDTGDVVAGSRPFPSRSRSCLASTECCPATLRDWRSCSCALVARRKKKARVWAPRASAERRTPRLNVRKATDGPEDLCPGPRCGQRRSNHRISEIQGTRACLFFFFPRRRSSPRLCVFSLAASLRTLRSAA